MSTTKGLTDRITIFHCLTSDEVTQKIDDQVFAALLGPHWGKFVEFCNEVLTKDTVVSHVSCYIEDGEIQFRLSD